MNTTLIVLTVIDIVLLIAGLAIYLWIVGTQLTRVAGKLEECSEVVAKIKANAEPIRPGVERINRTGNVIAGALPLLYSMGEGIVTGATYEASTDDHVVPSRPAMGRRRSRLAEGVGYRPID